jgi:hypothetical protein
MRKLMILSCLLLLAGGCGSKFAGEWVEEGTYGKDGVFQESAGQRRLALRFDPPATVRYGAFIHRAGVVDEQSVEEDTYFTLQNRQMAQFGSVIARVDRDHLVATISGDIVMRFQRVTGKSVFPPQVYLPSLAKAKAQEPVPAVQPVTATEVIAAAAP